MLVQTVIKRHGRGYCEVCGQIRECSAVIIRSPNRDALARHLFCQACMDEGVGVEMTLTDPVIKQQLARRRRLSRRKERDTAREVEGRLTPASGATRGDGDVVTEDFMIEEKATSNRSYRLSVNTLKKALAQAAQQRRDWLFRIRLPDGFDIAVLDWRVLRGWVLNESSRTHGV